jgi:hypothetical protein
MFVPEALLQCWTHLSASGSISGVSCFTTAPIPAGTQLLSCPHELVLDYAKAAAAFPPAFAESVSPHTVLCFFACKERLKGEGGRWWPYMQILPTEFNTPLYFDDEDTKFLDGCNLNREAVGERRFAWQTEWEQGVEALKSLGEDTAGYNWCPFLSLPPYPQQLTGM